MNYAIFAPMAKDREIRSTPKGPPPAKEVDREIQLRVARYLEMEQRELTNDHLIELLKQDGGPAINGTPGTTYLKLMGHRDLTQEDRENIISKLGTPEQQQVFTNYSQARESFSQRLDRTRNIGLVIKLAGMTYTQYYLRIKRPETWKPEEMLAFFEVLDRLTV